MGYTIPTPYIINYLAKNLDESIKYSEYIAENLDKILDESIKYSKYIAENLDKSIKYSEYIAENLDKSVIRDVSDSTPSKYIEINNETPSQLNWWCNKKNKTSTGFWKYKM